MMIKLKEKVLKELDRLPYLLIGLSGGVDSSVLTHLLMHTKWKNKIVLCHVNHKLRNASEKEEETLIAFAKKHDCKLHHISLNLALYKKNHPKDSMETAARNLRYDFYATIAKQYKVDTVLLGHHADDLMETMLMRMVFGASTKGLIGMQEHYQAYEDLYILRPLLSVNKDMIYAYAKENKVVYFEDETNTSLEISRNRYRNNIVPLLYEENPKCYESFYRISEQLALEEEYWKDINQQAVKQSMKEYPFGWRIDKTYFNQNKVLIKRFAYYMLKKFTFEKKMKHIEILESVLLDNRKNGNHQWHFSHNYVLYNAYDYCYLVHTSRLHDYATLMSKEIKGYKKLYREEAKKNYYKGKRIDKWFTERKVASFLRMEFYLNEDKGFYFLNGDKIQ